MRMRLDFLDVLKLVRAAVLADFGRLAYGGEVVVVGGLYGAFELVELDGGDAVVLEHVAVEHAHTIPFS